MAVEGGRGTNCDRTNESIGAVAGTRARRVALHTIARSEGGAVEAEISTAPSLLIWYKAGGISVGPLYVKLFLSHFVGPIRDFLSKMVI